MAGCCGALFLKQRGCEGLSAQSVLATHESDEVFEKRNNGVMLQIAPLQCNGDELLLE